MKANRYDKLNQFKEDDSALMFNMLINAALAVVIVFALMNIGTYINGQISDSLISSYPEGGANSTRTTIQNLTVSSLENITSDYQDVLDIQTVTAIIMVIMLPLAAVISIKKLI